jgi:hypothetical protein
MYRQVTIVLRVRKRLSFDRQTSNRISKFNVKALKNIEIEVSEGDRFARCG